MAGHLVSSPVSRFHIREGTDVEPASFWSQGTLVNGVRTWEFIMKHDFTQRFQGHTLVSALVSGFHIGPDTWCLSLCLFSTVTDVESAIFSSQGPLVKGVRSWQLIIKHDLTHRFQGLTLGVRPSVRVPHL